MNWKVFALVVALFLIISVPHVSSADQKEHEFFENKISQFLKKEKISGEDGGGFIFDGFPRTLKQADALDSLLKECRKSLDFVIEMKVDDDALVSRITGRSSCGACGEVFHDVTNQWPSSGECPKCSSSEQVRRADDNEESLRQRLMEYYKKTSSLIGYYYAKGDHVSVNGLASVEEVQESIAEVLNG